MTGSTRLNPKIINAYSKIGTPTIHEALGRFGEMDPAIQPLWPGARVCGPAYPAECQPADNLMVHQALAPPSPVTSS